MHFKLLTGCRRLLHAGDMSQPNGSNQDTQQEASTVATPAGKEASSADPSLDTPASGLGNGYSPTPGNAGPTSGTQQGDTNSSVADADAISVKQLIQQRSLSSAVSEHPVQSACHPITNPVHNSRVVLVVYVCRN